MKLIAQVKLLPTSQSRQAELLRCTFETANSAANYISEYAWAAKTFRQYDLHRACYHNVRKDYELSAQMTVRTIAKVADAYNLDRKKQLRFHRHYSIAYDKRILSWKLHEQTVSIWTVGGRQIIPFIAGELELAVLPFKQGEADLVYRRDEFYLRQICEADEPPIDEVDELLGFDLGICQHRY